MPPLPAPSTQGSPRWREFRRVTRMKLVRGALQCPARQFRGRSIKAIFQSMQNYAFNSDPAACVSQSLNYLLLTSVNNVFISRWLFSC